MHDILFFSRKAPFALFGPLCTCLAGPLCVVLEIGCHMISVSFSCCIRFCATCQFFLVRDIHHLLRVVLVPLAIGVCSQFKHYPLLFGVRLLHSAFNNTLNDSVFSPYKKQAFAHSIYCLLRLFTFFILYLLIRWSLLSSNSVRQEISVCFVVKLDRVRCQAALPCDLSYSRPDSQEDHLLAFSNVTIWDISEIQAKVCRYNRGHQPIVL
jgi:glucan phosphoethanolaminetransferase (alkaline phosphatase superfamily)